MNPLTYSETVITLIYFAKFKCIPPKKKKDLGKISIKVLNSRIWEVVRNKSQHWIPWSPNNYWKEMYLNIHWAVLAIETGDSFKMGLYVLNVVYSLPVISIIPISGRAIR